VLFLLGCAVSSLGNLLTGVACPMAAAFSLQLLRGCGTQRHRHRVNTLIQRQVPAATTGRVFGTLYGAVGAAAAMSYLARGGAAGGHRPPGRLQSQAAPDCSAPASPSLSSAGSRHPLHYPRVHRHPDGEALPPHPLPRTLRHQLDTDTVSGAVAASTARPGNRFGGSDNNYAAAFCRSSRRCRMC
jgi:hypothetical protein